MKLSLARVLGPTEAVKPGHAICLFVLLQIYFSSNMLSFGFWKSSDSVFGYMVVFYGVWIAGLVVALSMILATARRFNDSRIALAVLVVLSVPFAWDLWVRSVEIDSRAIRHAVRILLLPAMYLYFRIGLKSVRWTGCAVLLLCVLSFTGHAGLSISTGKSHAFDTVEMDRRPNVHVIMLDSFTHAPFAEEFMDVENPAADYLATLDDAIYADSMGFVENVATLRSWETLFNLGQTYGNPGYFSGVAPSRLAVLLRRNGYSISTGYSSNYFGSQKGEHVDHYHKGQIFQLGYDLSCTSKKGKLGFCSWVSQYVFFSRYRRLVFGENYDELVREWPDTVFDLIDRAERDATGPLFSGFHIGSPIGHTPMDYHSGDVEMFEEYKQFFVEGVERARQVLEKIDRLRRQYPESIFIVSGDHGPYLSRNAPKEERRFIVLDRHAVALAMLNASNLCASSRNWLDRQRYLTPSRMLVAALACNGQSTQLTENFTVNEEFVRFGESFTSGGSEKR